MADQNFDKELEEFQLELEARIGKEVKPLIDIIKSYDVNSWSSWLEDISSNGIAYPISNFSGGGDVIVDMVDYLKKNDLSLSNYEDAVTNTIASIANTQSRSIFLESLLNALIAIGGLKANKILLNLVQSRVNLRQKGKYDYIKSVSLLALARSGKMDNDDKKELYAYLIMRGLYEMKHDPSFYGNALRFCYLHLHVKFFFKMLTLICQALKPQNPDNEAYVGMLVSYEHSIVDKLEELNYRKLSVFYSNITKWLLENCSGINAENSLLENKLFDKILRRVAALFKENALSRGPDIDNKNSITEIAYIDYFNFLISFILEDESSNFEFSQLVAIQISLLEKEKDLMIAFLKYNIGKRMKFVRAQELNLIPVRAASEQIENINVETMTLLVDIYDEEIYSYRPTSNTEDIERMRQLIDSVQPQQPPYIR